VINLARRFTTNNRRDERQPRHGILIAVGYRTGILARVLGRCWPSQNLPAEFSVR
jgi:hypothetical protein